MNNSSGSEKQGMSGTLSSFENLLLQSCRSSAPGQGDEHQQTGLQAQINAMMALMRSGLERAQLETGLHAPEVQQALTTFHAVQPLLLHLPAMLNLLLKAGIEINGNPFLDEDTTLHEIRRFLQSGEIKALLPQVIDGLEPDQLEIAEDLLDIDPDSDLGGGALNGGFFPVAEIRKTGAFPLSELVGPRAQADGCLEWDWVRTNSGLTRHTAGDKRIAGFVLDLNLALPDVPSRLQPMLAEARHKGIGYLIFY